MAIVKEKILFTVAEKTERTNGTILLKLLPSASAGVEWESPSEVFVVVPADTCALTLGETYPSLTVAQYDDGIIPE